jgi:hypothetical protein
MENANIFREGGAGFSFGLPALNGQEMMAKLDTDQDGIISVAELRRGLLRKVLDVKIGPVVQTFDA